MTADSSADATAIPYNDDIVRKFVVATVFWGVAAFTMGVVIALQLAFPVLNLDLEWTTFGRLRPVHTSAAIFAFGGSALFATSFHVVQRTCRATLFGGPGLANFIFWGYQLVIVLAALAMSSALPRARNTPNPNGTWTCC